MFERRVHRKCALGLAVVTAAIASVLAAGAQAADPPPGQPVANVGPVSSPDGGVTASGSATSGGKADACVNNQHSGANPGSSQPATVNDHACTGPSGAGGGGASTASSGAAGHGGPQGAPSSGKQSGTAPKKSGAAGTTRTAKGPTAVTASQARGLRISGIQYQTSGVQKQHQLGVVVSLRDELGRPIKGAVVTLAGKPGANTGLKTRTATSGALGTVRFAVPTTSKMLGKRLELQIGAKTPTTRIVRLSSVQLPRGASTACKK